MSQHAIEDLIEETVHLIDQSDFTNKRDYLAGIYRIQAYYDTSNTYGRVREILEKYRFKKQEEPEIELPALIHHLLLECQRQQKDTLLTYWYGLLVNGYIDGVFEWGKDLLQLAADKDLLAIRNIAAYNAVKRLRGTDEALILPVLKDEIEFAGGLEREYAIRFFLEFKKTPEALIKAYQKKVANYDAGALETMAAGVAALGWIPISGQAPDTWCWYKEEAKGRRFLHIAFDAADKFLLAHLGFQHQLILQWQQRTADTAMYNVHFKQMVTAFLPHNNKFMNSLGAWKFDLSRPAKILQAKMDNLLNDIQIAEEKYFSYLNDQFPAIFFTRDPEQLIREMEEGIVPDYALFDSTYSVLLAFAFHDQNPVMMEKMRERLRDKQRRSAYETKYLAPFLAQEGAPMPPLHHYFLQHQIAA